MILYGAAYYPEHWGSDRLLIDIELMKQANFNVVRMAEFAWGIIQRKEGGSLNLNWLDDAINRLGDAGINTILGTPTATPPKWLMDQYPDIYIMNKFGLKEYYGSRRHYCINSTAYIRIALEFVKRLALHYKNNHYVTAWQIDNELGGDYDICYCENCKKAFQLWLRDKYQTIEQLNHEWGTDVWSHVYSDFSEIEPVRKTQSLPNPSCALDYKRFHSDGLISFMNAQAEILRAINPDWEITTNIFGIAAVTNNYKLNQMTDFVSWDFYPNMDLSGEVTPYSHAMGCDICRGFKQKAFVRMETQSGTPGGDILFVTPRPGDLARWSVEAIARGAQGILFFRWRSSSSGAEEYWHGILNHDGVPGRLYEEVRQLGGQLVKLKSLPKEITKNKVAILHNQEINWAFEIQPLIINYEYYRHVQEYYKVLLQLGVTCDFIHPEQGFEGYSLILAPNFLFCTQEFKLKLEKYAMAGGQVIMDYRSGVKHPNNRMIEETLPTGYADLLGIQVREYGLIFQQEEVKVSGKVNGSCKGWFDVMELVTAEKIAQFETEDYYGGLPAIAVNSFGKGKAYYLGTALDEQAMREFLSTVIQSDFQFHFPEGFEAVKRADYLFVINHTKKENEIALDGTYEDVISGELMKCCILSGGHYVILKKNS
jgi:beta-galactosidase